MYKYKYNLTAHFLVGHKTINSSNCLLYSWISNTCIGICRLGAFWKYPVLCGIKILFWPSPIRFTY